MLVPEGGSRRRDLPAVVAWRVARDLAHDLALDRPEVAVIPLHLRDDSADAGVAERVGRLLSTRVALVLGARDHDGAWLRVSQDLEAGRAVAVEPLGRALVHLRRWRPPRDSRGLVVLFTGLSGSGKSTVARDLTTALLVQHDREVTLLDGDVVRRLLSAGLGFDPASRERNVRRIGWVAARVAQQGGVAVCSPIAPFDRTRREVRRMVEEVADLVLVHVSTPIEECERRDLKGLYARARRGEVPDFTGVSSPYEVPTDADVVVDTTHLTREQAVSAVLSHLRAGGWLGPATGA
ncbi:adenylyl-sulfate kinase [Aquipuribacter sp. SD81]|uniref:adenylyl-sulfate kinase n=1 Tax=Aquipuribacter sp. SD81 TaxID=3127703 RepID=UPI003019C0C0